MAASKTSGYIARKDAMCERGDAAGPIKLRWFSWLELRRAHARLVNCVRICGISCGVRPAWRGR
jgi:hypothetical protein